MVSPTIADSKWLRQAFLVSQDDIRNDPTRLLARSWDASEIKFTDTKPGGSLYINPPPQFTKFCDIRPDKGGRGPSAGASTIMGPGGLGSVYSKVIEDNSQVVHMRCGVPAYNSLTTFFTGFYNAGAGRVAKTGRGGGLFYKLGRVAGFVVPLIAWPLLVVSWLGTGLRLIMDRPSSRFYNLKPTMPVYWNAVQTIVNHICINTGMVARPFGQEQQKMANGYEFPDDLRKKMHAMLPDIFNESGSIDVFALANRGQRLARQQHKRYLALGDGDFDLATLSKKIQAIHNEKLDDGSQRGYQDYLDQWIASGPASTAKISSNGTGSEGQLKDESDISGYFDFLKAELDDGAAFASFRVNYTGTASESFQNTTTQSEIQSKFNSISSQSRSTNFNLANGNIANIPFLNSVKDAVTSFASGALASIEASGLIALGGSAFVDIPKHYDTSSSSLNKTTYTMDLMCPYNNPVSRLINIVIPFAMILAAGLPRSTGKQSYTGPFICEFYDRGRCTTRLGIINDISLTRGEGNIGWDKDGNYLNAKLSFSVEDLSSILHMPISEGFNMNEAAQDGAKIGLLTGTAAGAAGGPATAAAGGAAGAALGGGLGFVLDTAGQAVDSIAGVFDDENVFTDYMSTLASVGLPDMIYPLKKIKRNLTRIVTKWEGFVSPARYASIMGDMLPSRIVSAFYKGTVR